MISPGTQSKQLKGGCDWESPGGCASLRGPREVLARYSRGTRSSAAKSIVSFSVTVHPRDQNNSEGRKVFCTCGQSSETCVTPTHTLGLQQALLLIHFHCTRGHRGMSRRLRHWGGSRILHMCNLQEGLGRLLFAVVGLDACRHRGLTS